MADVILDLIAAAREAVRDERADWVRRVLVPKDADPSRDVFSLRMLQVELLLDLALAHYTLARVAEGLS